MKLERLLVPLDGSRLAERALPYATALARAAKSRLLLVRVTLAPALSPRPDEETDAAAYLQVTAEKVRRRGVAVERRVYYRYLEPVGRSINNATREERADLVVMSTHGRGGLGRWIYGSAADEVLRTAKVPVLLVSATCERPWPSDRPPRILVPLDGSEVAAVGLERARQFAHLTGGELVLLRVIEPPAYPYGAEGYGYPGLDLEALRQEAEQALGRTAAGLRDSGLAARVMTEMGFTSSTIARVAREQGVDVIAMATHGRGGLARAVLGSAATGVMQQATVPLLVSRPLSMELGSEQDAAHDEAGLTAKG